MGTFGKFLFGRRAPVPDRLTGGRYGVNWEFLPAGRQGTSVYLLLHPLTKILIIGRDAGN